MKQMKEFLSTYIELLQSNHDMVGQVKHNYSVASPKSPKQIQPTRFGPFPFRRSI